VVGAQLLRGDIRVERGTVYARAGLDGGAAGGLFSGCEEGFEESADSCLLAHVSWIPEDWVRGRILADWVLQICGVWAEAGVMPRVEGVEILR
jgi:hypothetical protein